MFVYGRPHPDGSEEPPPMSILNFDDFMGRMFLLPMDDNRERKQATISDSMHTLDQIQPSREDQLRFKLNVDGEKFDDSISYHQLKETLADIQDTGQTEDGLYSSLSKTTEVHTLLLTQIAEKIQST